jgi:hypothetical protein
LVPSSLKFWKNSAVNVSSAGLFFGDFLLLLQFHSLLLVYLGILIYMFRNLSTSSRFSNLWNVRFQNIPKNPLDISAPYTISLFISTSLGHLVLLANLAKCLSILFIFSKTQLSVSFLYLYYSFRFCFINYSSYLYFFLPTVFEFGSLLFF